MITSDHGTELFDHGGKGHRSTLYEEQIHIPLIVHWPGHVVPGRHPGVTRMIDVGPTLLELADRRRARRAWAAASPGWPAAERRPRTRRPPSAS